jgi:hypothetical protein
MEIEKLLGTPLWTINLVNIFLNITFMNVMYLNFIDDKVVHPSFALFQVMGVDLSLKMYPLVDFLVFMSLLHQHH